MFWLDSLVGNLSEFCRIACWSEESSLLNFFLEQSSLLNFFVVFAACEKHCILLMFWLDWLVGNLSKFRQIECSRAAAAEKSKKKNWTELRSARRHKTSHFGRGGAIYNIESCAFLHQQWGSYLLIIVILSGMTLPRVVHRTNYFTSLIATTGTSFTSLFPRRALILRPWSQDGHLFYDPDPRSGTYLTSLIPRHLT